MGTFGDLKDTIKGGIKSKTSRSKKAKYNDMTAREAGLDISQQRTMVNTGVRLMFYRPGCDVCPMWASAIQDVNLKLPRGNQISYVDVTSTDPRINWLDPGGTPQVYIDGVVIKGATSTTGQLGYLKGFLQDELELQVNPNDYLWKR